MKLSIITINYNNAAGLCRTLDSVAAQRLDISTTNKVPLEVEHIIVDGNSTDESVQIIRDYEQQLSSSSISLMWVSEPDKGIYNAMNKGIEVALGIRKVDAQHHSHSGEDSVTSIGVQKGEEHHHYIQILNSGDLMASDKVIARMYDVLYTLNTQHSTLNDKIGVPILYGNMLKSYDMKTIINRDTCGNGMYTPESFLYFYKGTLNHDCAYIRRDLFEKYGLYNEQMKICSDWEWYVRAIVLGGEKPVYTDIDVTIFDMNGVSESYGKNAELIKKERREYLESILPPSILHDYDLFAFPILQYQRLKKYHLWGIVYFMERVLFKLEKWGVLRK